MSTHSPSNRATLRTFVVLFLAAVVLALCLPDIRRVWQPEGDFGYSTDYDNVVTSVDSDSPADRAGLKVGDRIDIASTNRDYQQLVTYDTGTFLPGQRVVVAVKRGATERYVAMVSRPEAMDSTTAALIVGRELAMLLFVGVGAALVLLRPSITTWAFYAYCLGLNGAPNSLVTYLPSPSWGLSAYIASEWLSWAGYVGVAVFAALFLHEATGGWRRWVFRLSPFALLIFGCLSTYVLLGSLRFGWPTKGVTNLSLSFESFLAVVALYALVETYVLSRGADRQRIRWVIVGFGVALVTASIDGLIYPRFNPPYWLHESLSVAGVVAPLTVAYAVIRHRIIDVSFVISRALVYAILTALLIGIFSLTDWFFTDYLRATRVGTVAEVIAILAFGFSFRTLHLRVNTLIDATFFRQRHRAEVQLARVAAALSQSPNNETVESFLVNDPTRALALASAALFRRRRDGIYMREQSVGWTVSDLARLDRSDDPLLTLAKTENGPLSLYDRPWRTEGVPAGAARPAVALPIIVRGELAAIVFYGSHVHGEALDPDEIKTIASLTPGAAAAYDHLEAEAMRNKNESLQRENESLRTQLAEAQIQPA